jgi:putative FmdB family regulatory protein
MPIYEFQCEACGHVFESWQKISDPNPDKCPSCGAAKVEKLISSTSFILQGKGWYATDYGGKTAHMPVGDKAQKEDAKRSAAKTAEQTAAKAADKSAPAVSSSSTTSGSGSGGSSGSSGSGGSSATGS